MSTAFFISLREGRGAGPMRKGAVGPAAAATAVLALAIVVAGCSGSVAGSPSASTGSSGAASAGADVIKVAASEYKFDPSSIATKAGIVTFEVTNAGTTEHEFEIFKGETVVDQIEGMVPGLTRQLTVTLDAGEYTYVCKLAAHDTLGMKGVLTVSPT